MHWNNFRKMPKINKGILYKREELQLQLKLHLMLLTRNLGSSKRVHSIAATIADPCPIMERGTQCV